MPSYDVAIVTDLRYPGGNSSSVVEEVKAQAAAGYTTALVHVPAAHMKRRRSFNHRIIHCLSSGMATLELGREPVHARAVIVRQPRIFADDVAAVPRVSADVGVFVINHPPFDGRHPLEDPYYRPAEVHRRVEAAFGPMQWAPIGPRVRRALEETGEEVPLANADWHNVIDVGEWRTDRARFAGERPVIGRHSRGHKTKWPSSRADILAAYPADERFGVRVLGGADPAVEAIGALPANWTVFPFGTVHPARFLRDIDYFVYFHHPDWVEAFGRNVIEAMASGAPAILPRHFEPLLGDTALYAEPGEVQDLVQALHDDPSRYAERAEQGRAFVDERFGAGVHVRRLQALIGEPSAPPPVSPAAPSGRRRVLLVSTDPHGVAAVIRLLHLARRLASDREPVFTVTAPCTGLVTEHGYLCERVDTAAEGKRGGWRWVAKLLREIVERERAEVVVVAGQALPRGVEKAAREIDVPFVWLAPPDAADVPWLDEVVRADGAEAAAEVVRRMGARR